MDFNKISKVMYYKIQFNKYLLLGILLLASFFSACKKADNFYSTLDALPQVSKQYPYKAAYVTGDILVITGRLHPEKNLIITIGGIQATITQSDEISSGFPPNEIKLNQLSIVLTAEMEGRSREVKISSDGQVLLAPSIDVFSPGGEGSFNTSLKSVQTAGISNAWKYFYCVNGKGDVYYYAPETKDIRHISKDGGQDIIYDLSGAEISSFLAGGVDPAGNFLYFSVQTSTGYFLQELDLKSKALSKLNHSQSTSAPYEGAINSIQMIVTGIYPDAKGNLYMSVNAQSDTALPDAVVYYNANAGGSISYIYKLNNTIAAMPGQPLEISHGYIVQLRYSPDENLLYVLEGESGIAQIAIESFDMASRVRLKEFSSVNQQHTPDQYEAIGSFSGLKINLGPSGVLQASVAFGYMPMPGKRLQTLLYQSYMDAAKYGFPKWIVFDFANERSYAYSPGTFKRGDNGEFVFGSNDELLNYDEDNNLYMTSNGKSYLVKSQID